MERKNFQNEQKPGKFDIELFFKALADRTRLRLSSLESLYDQILALFCCAGLCEIVGAKTEDEVL
jgi:hypothetical protein